MSSHQEVIKKPKSWQTSSVVTDFTKSIFEHQVGLPEIQLDRERSPDSLVERVAGHTGGSSYRNGADDIAAQKHYLPAQMQATPLQPESNMMVESIHGASVKRLDRME